MTRETFEQIEARVRTLGLNDRAIGVEGDPDFLLDGMKGDDISRARSSLVEQGITLSKQISLRQSDVAGIKSKFELAMNPSLSYESRRKWAQQFYRTAPSVAAFSRDFNDQLLIENARIYLGCVYDLE